MPGLHNVIFDSGGAALAQIHLSAQKRKEDGGKMGNAVQVGPPAGWEPLLSPALQELSVARHLSCSVSGLARFSLP